MPVKHGKAREGYTRNGLVSSTELTKDHRSYVGNKHRRIETNFTKATARHRRKEEILVCGTRPSDGTRIPSSQRNRLDTIRWQKKKRQAKEDPAVNIL